MDEPHCVTKWYFGLLCAYICTLTVLFLDFQQLEDILFFVCVLLLFLWVYVQVPDVRKEFLNIAAIRSLLPKDTKVLALTATAKRATQKGIIGSLEMEGCCVVRKLPNNKNMFPIL